MHSIYMLKLLIKSNNNFFFKKATQIINLKIRIKKISDMTLSNLYGFLYI